MSRRRSASLAAAWLLAGCAAAPGLHPGPAAPPIGDDDAIRLLEQASFGPTPETIAAVRRMGAAAYVDAQLRLPATRLPVLPPIVGQAKDVCDVSAVAEATSASGTATSAAGTATSAPGAPGATASPLASARTSALAPMAEPRAQCRRDAFSDFPVQRAFFRDALAAPDQLRQRTAYALGQIFVVSGRKNNRAYAMARYQQLLRDDAFVTFRQLLGDVTLSPMMGNYLDLADNGRAAGKVPTAPNENYAREVLQLFSVGLVRLHVDGTPVLGADARPLPTYGADEVRDLARALTGWTYPAAPGAVRKARNPPYYDGVLQPVPSAHDTGPKTLLGGAVVPGQGDPRRDLDVALDIIARHPNVGPFIGRRLIQALVTSNPSPQYVARITAVFDDDGHGVRGNLGAVVRAILLDPVARGDAKLDPGYGRAREPVLWLTGVLRALGRNSSDGVATSDGVVLIGQSAGMGENVYVAPSVFGFYTPDHALTTDSGGMLYAPEMAIVDSDTSLKRGAFAERLLFGAPIRPDPTLPDATGTRVELGEWEPLAAAPEHLVDAFDARLLHHRLPAEARQAIVAAVSTVPASDAPKRVRTAAFLIVAGPQYQVQQ